MFYQNNTPQLLCYINIISLTINKKSKIYSNYFYLNNVITHARNNQSCYGIHIVGFILSYD